MNRIYILFVFLGLGIVTAMAQSDHIADGLASVATIAGETRTVEDSVFSLFSVLGIAVLPIVTLIRLPAGVKAEPKHRVQHTRTRTATQLH